MKSILCLPSLNPDIRRAAAEQLLSLAPDPRFAQALSDASLLHTLLHELISTDNSPGCCDQLVQGAGHSQAEAANQQLHQLCDMQLAITCLQLLVALVQHCCEAKALLLQSADRSAMNLHQQLVIKDMSLPPER